MSIKNLIKNAQPVDLTPELTESEKKIIDQKGKVAAAILNKRYELNMNQTQFAAYMKVSQGMISKWENGDYNFTIATLQEICEKLNLQLHIDIQDIVEEPETTRIFHGVSSVKNKYHQFPLINTVAKVTTFNSGGHVYAAVY